ncbi:MAG TPA: protein kinase [Ktedonobacteraceae bacterium]
MPSRIGEIFGSYELIQFLGRGGFAEVYLGKHTQLPQQMAAIKILDKQLIIHKSQQFQKEASIVATLRHPNIVQMYDYNVYSNPMLTTTLVPYIVMEYAPNKSLRVKYQRGQALPMKTILTYTRQIADALQYAHEQGVMHLDVKPENILINAQNKLLLSDFGLATLLTEEEKTGDIQGTLSYMSPEQLDGKPGFASDQYALGVMVYEWVSGHLPFTGHSVKEVIEKHLTQPPPSLQAQVNTLPGGAEDIIFKALAKQVSGRFPTVETFAEALDQALSLPRGKPQGAPQVHGAMPGPPPLRNANPILPLPDVRPPVPSFNVNPILPLPDVQPPAPLPNANPIAPAPDIWPPAPLPNATPIPPFPVANQGMQQGRVPTYPNRPSPGGESSQVALPGGILPLTPPNPGPLLPGSLPGNTPPQANVFPSWQINSMAGGNLMPPAQANPVLPPFSAPANQLHANSSSLPNLSPNPFQAGPPPGMQAPISNPFLNTIPGTPSSTTVFGLPGSAPFPGGPGAGGPGPLPPYLTGGTTGQYTATHIQENSLSNITRTVLKRPPAIARRRRQPLLIAGALLNTLGAIFIGVWVAHTGIDHDTGWWAFIFSLVVGLGGVTLFFNSGNKWLNFSLSVALTVYWGFIGFAIGALGHGSLLPGPGVLAFLFSVSALSLHIYLIFSRR